MGRKAAKIAGRKAKGEAIRQKLYGKYGKLIVKAVKAGGGSEDPGVNATLAKVLADASRLRVPRELVERNLKRATDGSVSATDYAELTYEAYGAGGVGVVIEALSDNANRAAADVKTTVNKWGGKLAAPGSVLFNFERRGIIVVRTGRESGTDRDAASRSFERVFEIAVENGGVDVAEMEGEEGAGRLEVRTAAADFARCQRALEASGFNVDEDASALAMVPLSRVEAPDCEAAKANETLVEKLLELDDVDAVYTQ
jgi:YebC/PmpR family DNA-binding regulatory protein